MKRFSILLAALLMGTGSLLAQSHQWFTRHILSDKHAMMSVDTQKRYLLINVRLATGKPDYYVPLDISRFGKDGSVLLDLNFNGNYRTIGNIEDYSCWQLMKESDTFDTTNREAYRPVYHHTPLWGWMNDMGPRHQPRLSSLAIRGHACRTGCLGNYLQRFSCRRQQQHDWLRQRRHRGDVHYRR